MNFDNVVPKSIVKCNSTTPLALNAKGKENCKEKLKTDLLMIKLNDLRHHTMVNSAAWNMCGTIFGVFNK